MAGTDKMTFSPNKAINTAIEEMLPCFSDTSQRRIRKAILAAKKAAEKHRDENTDAAARHVFRELIPASHLNRSGWVLEYQEPIQGKTPDWLDRSSGLLLESYTYERGGSSRFMDRVAAAVTDKCNKYADIAVANNLRLVVSVYLDFLTGMSVEECREEAASLEPVFEANGSLWALLFFTETMAIGGTQHYGFLCFCMDPSLAARPNWPFDTEFLK